MTSSNITDSLQAIRLLLHDARLADAVFILDGFEHVLDDMQVRYDQDDYDLVVISLQLIHYYDGTLIVMILRIYLIS